MGFLLLTSFFLLLLATCVLTGTTPNAPCPDGYMSVMRYGRKQCNQVIWRDLQLTGFKEEFQLPMVRSEGWPEDSWAMCMHGTLGPTDTTFLLKLWRPEEDVVQMKAIYWKNNSTVVMEEYEEGHLAGQETIAPNPYPFAHNEQFSIVIQITNNTLTYNLCGVECFTVDRYLPDSDIHTLQLFIQAQVHYLDLWCM